MMGQEESTNFHNELKTEIYPAIKPQQSAEQTKQDSVLLLSETNLMWKMECSNCGTKDLGRTGCRPIRFVGLMFCDKNCAWSYFLNFGDEHIIERFHLHVNDLIDKEEKSANEMNHSTRVIMANTKNDCGIQNLQYAITRNVAQTHVLPLSTRNNVESGHTATASILHKKWKNQSKRPPKAPSMRKGRRKVCLLHDEDVHCFGNALYEYCIRREAIRRLA